MSTNATRRGQHFSKVLNILSPFDEGEMELVTQFEVDDSLRSVPNCKTVEKALGMSKNGKAAGSYSILPEMLKSGKESRDFVDMLTDLVSGCGRRGRHHRNGWIPSLSSFPRKATCTPVTIGGG